MDDNIRNFARAVMFGTLAGGGIWLLLTVPIGIGMAVDGLVGDGLLVAALPLLIAGGGTLAGMVIVGMPVTALLKRHDREDVGTYLWLGAVLGFLLPILVMLIIEDFNPAALTAGAFLGLFGVVAGTASASVWGGWREQLAETQKAWLEFEDEPAPAPRPKREKWLS